MAIFNSFLYVYQRVARLVSPNPQMVPRIAFWVWWRFASSTWSSKVLPIARTLGNAKAQFGLPSGNLTVCYWSHGHWNSEFSHEKWWFSIVMLVYQRLPSGNLLQFANWKPWPIEGSLICLYERWWFSGSQTVSLPGICTWILWEGQSPIALRRRGLDERDRLGHWFWDSRGTGAENARDWRWK